MSRFEGRHVDLPDRGTTFVRQSAGPAGVPTLILLHGLGATGGLNWHPVLEPLSRSYSVVAIDHRGHGRGLATRAPFRLVDCADDVAALATVLGIERFIAVGYSMGGPIAQLLWHRHSKRVSGLVLCATACTFTDARRRRTVSALAPMLKLAGQFAPRMLLRRLADEWLEGAIDDPDVRSRVMAEFSGSDPVALAQAAAAVGRFDSANWIGDIDVPAAVVVTQRDQLVQPEYQLVMAAALDDATVHEVAGDHLVCARRPELFAPVLLEACASVVRRSALA